MMLLSRGSWVSCRDEALSCDATMLPSAAAGPLGPRSSCLLQHREQQAHFDRAMKAASASGMPAILQAGCLCSCMGPRRRHGLEPQARCGLVVPCSPACSSLAARNKGRQW